MAAVDEYLGADTEAIAIPLVIEDDVTAPVIIPTDRLVCVVGPDLGRRFPIDRTLVIGRGAADIDLHSTDVSRRHARISRDGQILKLEDLGSSNGTLVNGSPVESTQLNPGDRIQIGSSILVVSRHDALEERLAQLQKLDAMNALVKGLAHDFNNVLMVVTAGLDELAERVGAEDPSGRRLLDDMNQAAMSAASLVRRLLRIGRAKPSTSELVHLGSLVDDTVALARRLNFGKVEILLDIDREIHVRGSRDELQQVLLNLLLNARDAMDGHGRVTIAAKLWMDRTDAIARHLHGDGAYLELRVTDNGIGMSEATLARIFEPFFTTKAPGKGNGLGLAMIYSSIRNHGGEIFAESTLGSGTTFRILLPSG